jgi:hypothetical protein
LRINKSINVFDPRWRFEWPWLDSLCHEGVEAQQGMM